MQEEKSETAGTERQVLFPAIMSIGEAAAYLTISKYFLYTQILFVYACERWFCTLRKDWKTYCF